MRFYGKMILKWGKFLFLKVVKFEIMVLKLEYLRIKCDIF